MIPRFARGARGCSGAFRIGRRSSPKFLHQHRVWSTQPCMWGGQVSLFTTTTTVTRGQAPEELVEVADGELEELVDQISRLNLVQVGKLGSCLKARLNIPDSALMGAPMAVAAAPAAAAPAAPAEEEEKQEERTIFDVRLASFDAKTKVKVIKEVRALLKLGLRESKELVEKAPCIIKEDCPKADCDEIIEKLKAVGAEVVLE